MSNFIQSNEDDAYMYAKFECLDIYRFLQLNTLRFDLLQFFYNAIMHKSIFGQAYCKSLLKRIIRKFNLSFYEFYANFCEFWKFE
jgi:hypothetical protein